MEELFFYFFGGLTIISATLILLSKNVIHSAFYLLNSLLGVAAIFVFALADFLAIAQVMVYIGGILVLMLFGIMYTRNANDNQRGHHYLMGGISSLILFGLIFFLTQNVELQAQPSVALKYQTFEVIGIKLMTHHILAFETIAIFLLIVLIGATYIAAREEK
ncbi:NADH-quinone oxidoreductase subunit J family protein [Sediminitomix flava]|uniref:NADH-quinone oxidoreductase subunit J n=1 Tax=Sediminitomix flava TaxID=379075 RepID=A0A315ZG52_SEDFL|nr:NADH-quinone oxidoreductase subunit J [Sediminitomix flava]PWJ44133.1 NADH dehydrogenase subunit J [Sediminitomix flava]